MMLRLGLAALLGGIIGWERERRNKQAGFKTHLLVSVGSALIMLTSIYGFGDHLLNHPNARFDPARLAAQVVSGIGFLGAGAILRHSNQVITGLTTAATLWVVAAIGLSVGSGFYVPAIATTAIVMFSVLLLRGIENRFASSTQSRKLRILVADRPGKLGEISTVLGFEDVDIRNIFISEEIVDELHSRVVIEMQIRTSRHKNVLNIIEGLQKIEGVKEVQFES
ncbi:MgtC/SapB family protein [Ammoniphilus sp. CFH 90114]|uniref:MgtC/SapB family protein n=1 Tax=Ammoniphilus sp. CFH 90114 TaxID=2493665 RepID=UPI00100EB97C|nr:MgtC/SapB family protein [Ammoniphilus sp. CFH 90114]RXT15436.1 MgtC/SapB family protein [Ammoniphilus sp. CFH 90114]